MGNNTSNIKKEQKQLMKVIEDQVKIINKQQKTIENIEDQLMKSTEKMDEMIIILKHIRENTKIQKNSQNLYQINTDGKIRNKREIEMKPRKYNSFDSDYQIKTNTYQNDYNDYDDYERNEERLTLQEKYGANEQIMRTKPFEQTPLQITREIHLPTLMEEDELPDYLEKIKNDMMKEKKSYSNNQITESLSKSTTSPSNSISTTDSSSNSSE